MPAKTAPAIATAIVELRVRAEKLVVMQSHDHFYALALEQWDDCRSDLVGDIVKMRDIRFLRIDQALKLLQSILVAE